MGRNLELRSSETVEWRMEHRESEPGVLESIEAVAVAAAVQLPHLSVDQLDSQQLR